MSTFHPPLPFGKSALGSLTLRSAETAALRHKATLGLRPKHDLREGEAVYIASNSLTQGEQIRRKVNRLD